MCGTLGIDGRGGDGVEGGRGRLDSVEAMSKCYAGVSSRATQRLTIGPDLDALESLLGQLGCGADAGWSLADFDAAVGEIAFTGINLCRCQIAVRQRPSLTSFSLGDVLGNTTIAAADCRTGGCSGSTFATGASTKRVKFRVASRLVAATARVTHVRTNDVRAHFSRLT
jgi:hypothetical protein